MKTAPHPSAARELQAGSCAGVAPIGAGLPPRSVLLDGVTKIRLTRWWSSCLMIAPLLPPFLWPGTQACCSDSLVLTTTCRATGCLEVLTGCSDEDPPSIFRGLFPPLMTLSLDYAGSPAKQTASPLTGTRLLPSPRSSWTAPSAWHSARPGVVGLCACPCCRQPAHSWRLLWIWHLLWCVESKISPAWR